VADEFEKSFAEAIAEGSAFTENDSTSVASAPPYAYASTIGRFGGSGARRYDDAALSKEVRAAKNAQRMGYINQSEFDWLISVTDDKEKRSTVEKILGYAQNTGGVLGRLDDIFGILETVSGYRLFVSASMAVTEGLKEKGGWGLAFSTKEFKRAWTGEGVEGGRTSYRDVLMKGGSNVDGVGGFAKSVVFDIALDPATYLTLGASAGTKVVLNQTTKASRRTAAGKLGRTATEILKESTGSKALPSSLTLSEWGHQVYQVASKELVEAQPEHLRKIIKHLDDGSEEFAQGGLKTLSPSDLSRAASNPAFRTAVTEYAVRNYDRLAMRLSSWNDIGNDLAGKAVDGTSRSMIRRGPGAMFWEWSGKAIGGLLNPIGKARDAGAQAALIAGGARTMFGETAQLGTRELGLRGLSRATVAGQVAGGLALGDAGLVSASLAGALLAEVPALAKKTASKALPTSAVRHIEKAFSSGVERMPVEDAEIFQKIKSGMDVAVEGKRQELVEFFSSPVVHWKDTSRALSRSDRQTIARHMDNPDLKLIEDGSPLYEPMKWIQNQFKHIGEQEREAGLLGASWEHYVTHFYGSRQAGAVTKFFKNSNRTKRLVAELSKESVSNTNSFSLHRVIATFDDAERLGMELDTDIGSILGRRWSASMRMQASMQAKQAMINRHGISALGEGFKNAHGALSQIGGKLGTLTRNFVDLGPPHPASHEEIARLADMVTDARVVPGVDWFATTGDLEKAIRAEKVRKATTGLKGKARKAAARKANDAIVDRYVVLKYARNKNLKALDKVSKSAFGKPIRKLSSGELAALRDYLNLTVLKNEGAVASFVKVGEMSNRHRMALVQIGQPVRAGKKAGEKVTTTGDIPRGIRGASVAHRLGREAPEVSDAELARMGKKLAQSRGQVDEIAEEFGGVQGGIDRKYRAIAREELASRPTQEAKLLRNVVEEGLQRSKKSSLSAAAAAKASAKSLRGNVPKELRRKVAAAASIEERLFGAKKALGDRRAAVNLAQKPKLEIVKRVESQLESAILRRDLAVERQVSRGLEGEALKTSRESIRSLSATVAEKTKDLKAAKIDMRKAAMKPRGELTKLEKAVERLTKEQADLADALKDNKTDIVNWIRARDLTATAAQHRLAAERLTNVIKAEQKIGARGDQVLDGKYYVPEVWLDAIDEAFGHTWNPSNIIDRWLSGYQRFQLLWKIPLTLPFAEHHGRNAITNAFLVSGHLGGRMLNPSNWVDAASVVAMGIHRGATGKSQVARAGARRNKIKGLAEPDLRGLWGDHKVKTATGVTYTSREIFKQATIRSITHGFVASEVDGVAGLFGDLMHGRLQPNLGSLAEAAKVLKKKTGIADFPKTVKEEGLVGGSAITAGKVTGATLDAMRGAMFNSARWVSRKSEHAVDVPFRLALFTDAVKRGKTFDEAAEEVRRHLNDWSRLSTFEKKYARTLIPFYSWIQFSMERFFKDLTTNPSSIQNPLRMVRAAQESMGATPPDAQYQSDWMAERIGIWSEQGEGLYKRYLLNGLNADEALRQVSALTEFANAAAHRISRLSSKTEGLAWSVFAPDANPANDLRFLAQMDFMTTSLVEGIRGRDFFSGAPTGTQESVLQDAGYSRYESARALVHPAVRESKGATFLRGILMVQETADGDPKKARANATVRWLLGKSPASRFVSTYERHNKNIIQSFETGEQGRVAHEVALEALGTRAYAYDPQRNKVYYRRDLIQTAQNLLLQSGYYQKHGIVYKPRTLKDVRQEGE